jgi:hypothetical protein
MHLKKNILPVLYKIIVNLPGCIVFCVILFAMCQCQFPYENAELDARKKIPVVEGYLDNTDGPHVISMHYARPYNFDKPEHISGARVYITDGLGNQYHLHEEGAGKYSTQKGQLTGVIGEVYQLNIEMPNGDRVLSHPAIIPQVLIEIDTLIFKDYTEWSEITRDATGTPFIVKKSGIGVFAVIRNIPEGVAYYRISPITIEHIARLKFDSSFSIDDGDSILIVIIDKTHWDTIVRPDSPPMIGSLIANGNYTQEDLTLNVFKTKDANEGARYPGSDCTSAFCIKEWIIIARVHAISPEIYKFYEDQLAQLNAPDRIYDPIPGQLTGNLFIEGDPVKPVLGMFEVSSVNRKNMVIEVHDFFRPIMYVPRMLPDTATFPRATKFKYGGKCKILTD